MKVKTLILGPLLGLLAAILLPDFTVVAGKPGLHIAQSAQANELLDAALRKLRGTKLPIGFASANGRLEAEYVDIASKLPGRVVEMLVEEGAMVRAGSVVARLDASEIEAQLRAAEAQVRRAERLREQAQANVALRASERTLARQELERASTLQQRGFGTDQLRDQRQSQLRTAEAAHTAALAAVEEARAAIDAANADVERLKTVLKDTVLLAPIDGRVQYKLVRAGEVVAAGARVATLIDLSDIYMTVFLPAREAGRLNIGDDARLVLDPFPTYVIPATVSFVASDAQFTPKSVETKDEREKLVFRVKLRIDADLLKRHEGVAKSGIRGIGYVRTRGDVVWPEHLALNLPQ